MVKDWGKIIGHYRLLNQEEEADKTFYKLMEKSPQSLVLVLVWSFNLPHVCWKYYTAERKESMRLLECMEENCLTQLGSETQPGKLPCWTCCL